MTFNFALFCRLIILDIMWWLDDQMKPVHSVVFHSHATIVVHWRLVLAVYDVWPINSRLNHSPHWWTVSNGFPVHLMAKSWRKGLKGSVRYQPLCTPNTQLNLLRLCSHLLYLLLWLIAGQDTLHKLPPSHAYARRAAGINWQWASNSVSIGRRTGVSNRSRKL